MNKLNGLKDRCFKMAMIAAFNLLIQTLHGQIDIILKIWLSKTGF